MTTETLDGIDRYIAAGQRAMAERAELRSRVRKLRFDTIAVHGMYGLEQAHTEERRSLAMRHGDRLPPDICGRRDPDSVPVDRAVGRQSHARRQGTIPDDNSGVWFAGVPAGRR